MTSIYNLNMFFDVFIFTFFRSLIFIKYADKTSQHKKISQLNKIIGIVSFVLFNCFSYAYLYQFGAWIPNILFVLSCFVYLSLFYLSDWIENTIIVLVYYITFWFTNYLYDIFDNYLNITSPIWDYITTLLVLGIVFFITTKVIPRFMNYKNYKLTHSQFISLLFFCLAGFISLLLYNNLFSITIGAICNVAIVMLSYEFRIIQDQKTQQHLLQERNKLLEEQDKLIKAKESEKYKSYQKSKEAEEKIRQINHDLNHHLNYLLSCEGDKAKIEEYIYKLKGTINQVSKYHY